MGAEIEAREGEGEVCAWDEEVPLLVQMRPALQQKGEVVKEDFLEEMEVRLRGMGDR